MQKKDNLPVSSIGEFGLIELLSNYTSRGRGVIKGIGDDGAVLSFQKNTYLIMTTDMLLEGVHFKKNCRPQLLGRKALACSLSDMASMGGNPKWAVVSLGLSASCKVGFAKEIYKGMSALARKYRVSIVGGDTVKSNKMILNVALLGEVAKKNLILRSHAKNGDQIFVTGKFGRSFKTQKHCTFTPRLKEAWYIAKNFSPTAMIDVSDGLIADLAQLCHASRVGAVIYKEHIPLFGKSVLREALYDGEDYELIFTLPLKQATRLERLKKKFLFTRIGEITSRKDALVLRSRTGFEQKLSLKGFRHF